MLRHRPDEFGLQIDEYGFVPLDQAVQAVRERYAEVEKKDVLELLESPDQYRFELTERGVRALYGHTFFVEMDGGPMAPPERLYMGATINAARRFKTEGIGPGDRFYVHLSLNRETAQERSREVSGPVVVEILAREAGAAGVEFFKRGEVVLTRQVPAQFVGEIHGLTVGAETQEWKEDVWTKPSSDQVTYGRKLRKSTRR
jgi:putative RNA 2'-phosphotransferase